MKSRYLFSVVCLFSASQAVAQTDSPYARFGYEGKVLRTPQERQQRMMMLVPNTDTTSAVAQVGLDPANQRYYLFGKDNQVLKTDTLVATDVARFLSMDPLTKSYPWYTPYQFAGNTPISSIDLDGLEPKSVVSELSRSTEVIINTGNPDEPASKPINVALTTVTYKYTEAASHLLSLVSGQPQADVEKVKIMNAGGGVFPGFNASEGGGAMTFPGENSKSYT